MKVFAILLGVVLLVFVMVQLFALISQRRIETYPYRVERQFGTFEIRSYEASLFTSVELPYRGYRESSRKGFSILAEYIFGGNKRKEKIAMTAPVTMSLEDSMKMMFLVPKKIKKEGLPEPENPRIEFREEPAKKVAAIGFGGWANDKKIKKYQEKLKAALDAEDISYTDRFYFLGYNPPYAVFNRKNEIIVELPN